MRRRRTGRGRIATNRAKLGLASLVTFNALIDAGTIERLVGTVCGTWRLLLNGCTEDKWGQDPRTAIAAHGYLLMGNGHSKLWRLVFQDSSIEVLACAKE